jgi:phosphoadenosine phosphosulfate reductase
MQLNLNEINKSLETKSTLDILQWCYSAFDSSEIKLSTSFGAEGIVLIDMLIRTCKEAKIFTIDTGRNFTETYDTWQKIIDKYNIDIEVYSPNSKDLLNLTKSKGPNLFYLSAKNRQQCCYIRKVKPMREALQDTKLWISALRREQSEQRKNIRILEWNNSHNLYKLNPLAKWSEETVWDYIRNNNLPYNKLYDSGYPTIGCAPCSRPVRPAQNIRSGRWWWEENEQRECGIHIVDGKFVSKKDSLNWNI